MIASLEWKGHKLEVDLTGGESVAIPIDPHGPQPSFFVDTPVTARPLRSGGFIGDMRLGGSCNAEMIELAPHCHGTHTECSGHVLPERRVVHETIYPQPCLARLVTLAGTPAMRTAENYPATRDPDEPLLTRKEIQDELREAVPMGIEALVIRTRPNDPDKRSRDYCGSAQFPVFSSEAMHWLSVQALKHLLIDTPSLDRSDDQGRLANHRTWWGLDGTVPIDDTDASRRSVTELIYVPDEIADGLYWLNIELSPLVGDATPSRPVLCPVTVVSA